MQKRDGIVRPSPPSAKGAASANSASVRDCKRFRRQHRLIKHEVVCLLRQGAHFHLAELGLKLDENPFGFSRLAISVPKRNVKFAVDRNHIKRVIREQFRLNEFRDLPVDMLVTLRNNGFGGQRKRRVRGGDRHQLRTTFGQLLGDISRRFRVPV